MPKITSASPRNFGTARGTARPPEPSDSGCVSGKGRLAAKAGGDGDGEPLGQPLQLRPGLGVMHALAGIDHRPLGADQERGRFLHMHGIGAVAGAQHRRVVQRLRHFLVPHVGGDFDDHRPAAAVLQLGEGAAEDVADFGGEVDRLGGFRKRLHRLAGVEVRVDIGEPARIAHRQHQHGNGLAVALRDAAHGVLRAGAVLHAERADAAPEVTREIASAMCMPMRSWRTITGRMSALAANSIR